MTPPSGKGTAGHLSTKRKYNFESFKPALPEIVPCNGVTHMKKGSTTSRSTGHHLVSVTLAVFLSIPCRSFEHGRGPTSDRRSQDTGSIGRRFPQSVHLARCSNRCDIDLYQTEFAVQSRVSMTNAGAHLNQIEMINKPLPVLRLVVGHRKPPVQRGRHPRCHCWPRDAVTFGDCGPSSTILPSAAKRAGST